MDRLINELKESINETELRVGGLQQTILNQESEILSLREREQSSSFSQETSQKTLPALRALLSKDRSALVLVREGIGIDALRAEVVNLQTALLERAIECERLQLALEDLGAKYLTLREQRAIDGGGETGEGNGGGGSRNHALAASNNSATPLALGVPPRLPRSLGTGGGLPPPPPLPKHAIKRKKWGE